MMGETFISNPMLNFKNSSNYVDLASQIIPGGAHTYAKGADQYPENMAPVITRGKGARVWDIDGNEFIEYGAGLKSVTLGHCFGPVDAAVRKALNWGLNFVRPHKIEYEAAEMFCDLIPCAEMVKFGLNGSDATSAAVRLARAYTGRDMVAVCENQPFFSVHDWFIGKTAMHAGIPEAIRNLTLTFRYNDPDDLRRVLDEHRGQVAAIILEAENNAAPVPGYFDQVRKICDDAGVVFILDEVITGFRWHLNGAQTLYGIQPDLASFAKGMANGYPVSALVGRREIMGLGGFSEDRDRVFVLSQTYGAQPWMLAAFLAVVAAHRSTDIVGRLYQAGSRLRQGVKEISDGLGIFSYFHTEGPDCALTFVTKDTSGQRSQIMRTIFLRELLHGGILAPSFVVNYAHTDDMIDQTLDVVAEALKVYKEALEGDPQRVLGSRPVRPAIRQRG